MGLILFQCEHREEMGQRLILAKGLLSRFAVSEKVCFSLSYCMQRPPVSLSSHHTEQIHSTLITMEFAFENLYCCGTV